MTLQIICYITARLQSAVSEQKEYELFLYAEVVEVFSFRR